MIIALGADHAGFEYKERIKELLLSSEYEVHDFGTHSLDSTDYPDYAHKVAVSIEEEMFPFGILICGTGIGMSIAANRHKGVRAAVVESVDSARYTRLHNNANILCLGSRITPWEKAVEIIQTFLTTQYEGGRHQRRVEKIEPES